MLNRENLMQRLYITQMTAELSYQWGYQVLHSRKPPPALGWRDGLGDAGFLEPWGGAPTGCCKRGRPVASSWSHRQDLATTRDVARGEGRRNTLFLLSSHLQPFMRASGCPTSWRPVGWGHSEPARATLMWPVAEQGNGEVMWGHAGKHTFLYSLLWPFLLINS